MKSVLIVIPTVNEELIIRENSQQVLEYCNSHLSDYDWRILVADNGSTDKTLEEISVINHDRFSFFHINQRGRGRALVQAWKNYRADYLCYMDSDLSVGLPALAEMLAALDRSSDIVVGSRFVPGASVDRSIKRETSSRVFICLVKFLLGYRGSDTQCGFKGMKLAVFEKLLPCLDPKHQTSNSGWFFDTELLLWAEAFGYRIHDLPVEWVERRNVWRKSRVNLLTITWNYLRQILELRSKLRKQKKAV